MSHESIVYGYIEGTPGTRDDYRGLQRRNLAVLDALPEVDDWPPLVRGMFSAPDLEPLRGTHRAQVIHFGASFKNFEQEDRSQWTSKFEDLLRRLYWFSAQFHIITELEGRIEIRWDAASGGTSLDDEPTPTNDWSRTERQDHSNDGRVEE